MSLDAELMSAHAINCPTHLQSTVVVGLEAVREDLVRCLLKLLHVSPTDSVEGDDTLSKPEAALCCPLGLLENESDEL